jgi:hypothetical protein
MTDFEQLVRALEALAHNGNLIAVKLLAALNLAKQ